MAARERAVVIGGSVAGLLGAAVLTRYFKEVIVFDTDSVCSQGATARLATPQANHVHGLLSSGWEAMAKVLPGLKRRLDSAGAKWIHFGSELLWHHWGAAKAKFDDPMVGPFMSRTMLEHCIREEVQSIDNVEIRSGEKVASLLGTSREVSGVILNNGLSFETDFVLDASGRASILPKILASLDMPRPKESRLHAGVRYCSCRFREKELAKHDWKALFIVPKPSDTRSGAVFPLENGDWLVTLMGRSGDALPKSIEEFYAYAGSLVTDELAQFIKQCEPISDLSHYRYKESRRRHYEKLEMPRNLFAMGDSVCSFNPIFGQGMAVCALEAVLLDEQLEAGSIDANAYFEVIAPLVSQVWDMIAVEDMRGENIEGQRSFKMRLSQWFTAKVYEKTATDSELTKLLYQVIHLQKPVSDLCRPLSLYRIFR